MKKFSIIFMLIICLFSSVMQAAASDVTLIYYYRNEPDPEIPPVLYVGWVKQCGPYSIKLLQDPVVTKSNQYMVSDEDTKYLVIRVAIKNNGAETGGWLTPDSFSLQDTYMGRIYGKYKLDITDSAKVAAGFKQSVFHAEIKPGETLYTSLVFSVYPDVQNWILTFAPRNYGNEPEETVSFRLPPAVFQEE